MAFTDAERQEIVDAILAKCENRLGACSLCKKTEWSIGEGLAPLSLSEKPGMLTLGGLTMPSIPLICNHCGNTLLVNTLILGLPHLFGSPDSAEVK